MKSLIAIIAFIIASFTLNAQNSVNLTIKLNPIQALTINPDSKDVTLTYASRNDYKAGKDLTCKDHLSVFSTGGFEVKVKSTQPNLTSDNGTINSSDVSILAEGGSSSELEGATLTRINLTPAEQTLISHTKGSSDKTFNVTYSARGNDEYVDLYNQSKSNEFKTTVFYTINPK